MNHATRLFGSTAVALAMVTGAAFAQGTLTGTRAVEDRIDDINRDVRTDLDRSSDAYRFGNPEFRTGLSGSASFGYVGKTGAISAQELTFGARLRHARGPLVQSIGLAVDYSESAGTPSKRDVFGVYDLNYYLTDRFYGFVLGRVAIDGLAATASAVNTDAFAGIGPGYRVVNTPDLSWRVQAGIGVSYLRDGVGTERTEVGYIASSRFFWRLTPTLFATNDTDVLTSAGAFRVNNDLGLNFKISDA
ncbi:MAG: YdiY family protein, partial [Gemmobacter sp.]